jgi:hypothetical protein
MMKTTITLIAALLFVHFGCGLSVQAQGVLHQVSISDGSEDADEKDGVVEIYDLELDMGWDNGIKSRTALFFRNMYLEAGAQVSSITLQLTTQRSFEDTIRLSIKVEDNAFPAQLQDSLSLVAQRNFRSDSVIWEVVPGEQNAKRQSPELLSLIQPVLSSEDWEASSGLYLIIEPADAAPDSGSSEYQCYSYDQLDSTRRPTLRVFVDSNAINGMQAPSAAMSLNCFPNPATDQITLSASTDGPWVLLNMQGQLVNRGWISANTPSTIDVSGCAPGIYILRDGRSGASRRVVLQ